MKAKDFEFDGKNLSDFGFVICNFGSKGLETISNGGQSTFNTISTLDGKKHKKVSVKYEDLIRVVLSNRWGNEKKNIKCRNVINEYIEIIKIIAYL